MNLNFPSPAYSGDTYQHGSSPTYIYNGSHWGVRYSTSGTGGSNFQGVSTTAPVDIDNTNPEQPVISMAQSNTETDGFLSSTDWNEFNNKGTGTSGTSGTSGANGSSGTIGSLILYGSSAPTENIGEINDTYIDDSGNVYSKTSSIDSVGTWTERTSSNTNDWSSVASSSDGTKLVAVVESGYINTSTDSGATWIEHDGVGDPNSASWYAVASSADGTKLVAGGGGSGAGDGGYIYTSTDSGATWIEQTDSGELIWYGVASSSDGTKLVAGGDGTYIYTSTDSGETWIEQTSSGQRIWYGVASSSDGTKLVAVDNNFGYIYTSTDSGVTWTEQTDSGQRNWSAVASSSDGTKLVAVVYGGYIYTSTDSGVTWIEQTSSGQRDWYAVASSSDGTKLVAVDNNSGYIYTSTDSGATWTEQTSGGQRNWFGVASSSDGTKLVAVDGDSGYIYTYSSTSAWALELNIIGTSGSSGTSGETGSSGTSGDNGTSGVDGSSGTAGTSGISPVSAVSSIRLFVSAGRSNSNVFLFNSVTRTADASATVNSDSAFLITTGSLTTIKVYLRQSSASSNSCNIDILKNANATEFSTATSIADITQTISSADTIFVYTFTALPLNQYDSIHIQVTPGVGGSNTYFGTVTVE